MNLFLKKEKTFVWVILIFMTLFSCSVDSEKIEVVDLSCEYLENPLGIDEIFPRLSWKIQTEENNFRQKAYRILVAGSLHNLENNIGDVWDSGKVISNESTQV